MSVPGALDPIFRSREPDDATPRTVRLLWQFFFFPLLIVGACLLPVVIILATRGGAPTPKELLDSVLKGSENEQRQASQQLANAIAEARNEVDAAAPAAAPAPGQRPPPPFFVDPAFADGLRRAFVQSRREEKSEERQIWLAMALGRTADPEAVPLLLETLYPPKGDPAPAPSSEVRLAAVRGLLFMESRAAEAALVRASADPDDAEVRNVAMSGLALLAVKAGGAAGDGPGVAPALARGLEDAHAGVQHNAAVALAVRGDAAGLAILERALTRADLERLGIGPRWQGDALVNGVRGLVALAGGPAAAADASMTARLDGLRGRIEVLAREDGDERVRQIARDGLERWRKN